MESNRWKMKKKTTDNSSLDQSTAAKEAADWQLTNKNFSDSYGAEKYLSSTSVKGFSKNEVRFDIE